MIQTELQRLAEDLQKLPGLRETLSIPLRQCQDVEEAALVLRRHGYDITAAMLARPKVEMLEDEELDTITGGTGHGLPHILADLLGVVS
ncbi:Nif11-like leader peptide family natural product precursor [Roseomonas sp. GC11]|uniref:Nif11-like leader peptide family natural product precursor n=1 Tax=Roseomonas sp. GC11 TaxID=2950546 RepID=UPI00210C08C0|nr:Nif11-like leader peptide family natural product precursor [Roseomonas sp. GC11]MCQ4162722.1 Nif11-like leader peptide family natural product precursor [Roseomonas sp. GC11]